MLPTKEVLEKQITTSGQPNLLSWCYFQTSWDTVVKSCLVDHDLLRSARQIFHQAVQKHPQEEADASFCFMNGLCQDPDLSANSTLAEATNVCDRRYPEPQGWKSIGFDDPALKEPTGSMKLAEAKAKVACAQGGYHCQAVYCQETYCKMDEYKQKFAHYSQETV